MQPRLAAVRTPPAIPNPNLNPNPNPNPNPNQSMDCADDDDATDVGMDDFAPMAAVMPKTLAEHRERAQSSGEPRATRVASPEAAEAEAEGVAGEGAQLGTPAVLMRL